MERDEVCVCGHPQSMHRSYGCTASRVNTDPKKSSADPKKPVERLWCQCKGFEAQKAVGAR